jgi:peptidoglycan LD-endopeptidase LytH
MQATLENIITSHQQDFHPVVPLLAMDKLVTLDLTEENKTISDEVFNDTSKFSEYIQDYLKSRNARYAIGGYGEYRTVYSRSKVFDARHEGEEPRRFHLGTDIWGPPHTTVIAPLDGIVHSFAFNNDFGDYGATIILTHQIEGLTFHSLYGHLSLNSIKNISEGNRIDRGDWFAEFGIPSENGQWPPHLHFQLILDLRGWSGDYPGVCKYTERDAWISNCPDPDLILQLNQYIR